MLTLLQFSDISHLTRCVRCNGRPGPIAAPNRAQPSTETTCDHCGHQYPALHGIPALLPFDNSVAHTDWLTRGSPVRRSTGPRALASELLWGGARASKDTSERLLHVSTLQRQEQRWLLVGGGLHDPGFQRIRQSTNGDLIAFDIYPRGDITFVADCHTIPLSDATIDVVVCQDVLEHVIYPQDAVDEIWRVLRDTGLVYVETPFLQSVHEGPYDFCRFTHSGHRWLFRHFDEIDSGISKGPWTALLWALRSALYGLLGNHTIATALCAPFAWIRLLDRCGKERAKLDGASELFFLGRKSHSSLHPKDAVSYYHQF